MTTYSYNEDTNVLDWVQYPNDTPDSRTNYTYDDMFRIAKAEANVSSGSALTASYTYDNDLLTSITTGSTTYTFSYGDFSQRSSIDIGDRNLATYSYTDEDHFLSQLSYGNGDTVSYEYDQQGRVTKETFEDGSTVTYEYDNTGALATVTDSATGIKTIYYYDLIDRMAKYVESGPGVDHAVQYGYDTDNNLTQVKERIGEDVHVTNYTYDVDNRVTQVSSGNRSKHYTYDGYGRTTQVVTKNGGNPVLTQSYTFQVGPENRATAQVSTLRNTSAGYDATINYTYDDNGNITSVAYGQYLVTYEYDSANQLIRENDRYNDFTVTYEYDDAGNILSKSYYPYTVGELGEPEGVTVYTYGDSSWGDLLTGYNDRPITYDEIGNPLNDGVWTYTWQNGRELASMTSGNTTWSYTYNTNGMRTSRANGTDTYNYIYDGSQLVQMQKNNTDTLYFDPAAGTVTWNGVTYYYVYNLQGDVIAILDGNGARMVEYVYDAWGSPMYIGGSLGGTLGMLNPIRYRGYVYDRETGLYYLQSRYYNPEVGRFINADALVSTGQGMLGNNMFAYCLNNPVNLVDWTGSVSLWYYLIVDHDMGYIHRAVQDHIKNSYNVSTEVSLSTFGRADILKDGGVWEIKHAGTNPAMRELYAYAQASTYFWLNEEVTHLGGAYAYNGSFYIGCMGSSYLVTYETPCSGVVLYTVSEVNNYNGDYAYVYSPSKQEDEAKRLGVGLVVGGVAALGGAMLGNLGMSLDPQYCLATI